MTHRRTFILDDAKCSGFFEMAARDVELAVANIVVEIRGWIHTERDT
jgi:hypothetical protein